MLVRDYTPIYSPVSRYESIIYSTSSFRASATSRLSFGSKELQNSLPLGPTIFRVAGMLMIGIGNNDDSLLGRSIFEIIVTVRLNWARCFRGLN